MDKKAIEIAETELVILQKLDVQSVQEYAQVPEALKITDNQAPKKILARFCTSCGTKVEDGSETCPNCGAKL